VEQRPFRRATHDSAEVRPDGIDDGAQRAAECGEDEDLLGVRIEPRGERAGGPLAGRDCRHGAVLGRHVVRRAELGQGLGRVGSAAQYGVLVGRAKRDVAAPGLAARCVELGPVLDQQPQLLRSAPTPHRVREQRPLVRVGARL
jgi:hypothetical protein